MRKKICGLIILLAAMAVGGTVGAIELPSSVFEQELSRLKYEGVYFASEDSAWTTQGEMTDEYTGTSDRPAVKSPIRAFLYSLAVPGLGQYYYGSKVKPVVFLAAEVTSWVFYFKFQGQGDDLTRDYEAFNRAHWLRDRYEQQLKWTYDEEIRNAYGWDNTVDLDTMVIDDGKISATELTHDLPDTYTQQYYEMTGKYDQFAWGWDDAVLYDSLTLDDFDATHPPPAIVDSSYAPYSARRLQYERMRYDANKKYDKATRMIYVSIVNRLISAFEAFFIVKKHNGQIERETWDLSRFKVRTSLKSCYTRMDTPVVTITYKF